MHVARTCIVYKATGWRVFGFAPVIVDGDRKTHICDLREGSIVSGQRSVIKKRTLPVSDDAEHPKRLINHIQPRRSRQKCFMASHRIFSLLYVHACWPPRYCRRADSTPTDFVPITCTYGWLVINGAMQRFAFASTMGLAAVALNGLLWLLSLPWIAWGLLRLKVSEVRARAVNEATATCVVCLLRLASLCTCLPRPIPKIYGIVVFKHPSQPILAFARDTSRIWHIHQVDEDRENKTASTSAGRGYFRTFFLSLYGVTIYLFALNAAIVWCTSCILGSCILWFRGLYSVLDWTSWKWSDMGRRVSGETTNIGVQNRCLGRSTETTGRTPGNTS